MKTRAAALLVLAEFLLSSCALVGHRVDPPRVAADVAVKQFATGRVKLLDVRSSHERLGREVARAVHIQFGPDRWEGAVDDVERENFLLALTRVVNKADEVFVICNYDVRSSAAVRLMRAHGYLNASSVAGGYMGARGQPGWQFFE